MTDTPQATAAAHSTIRVLAALAELGEATAAAIAEHAGIGYSTTTPKLRAWEESGQAERFRTGDGRTLWRLTDAGRTATATATTSPSRPDSGQPQPPPATPDPASEPPAKEEHPQDGDGPSVEADDPAQCDEPADRGADGSAAPQAPTTTATAGTPRAEESPAGTRPEDERHGSEAVDTAQDEARPAKARRTGGSLRGAVLDILEAHPDREYKTGELAKLIDAGNDGSGAAKASAGAVANAVTKLVADGKAVQTVDRPATFQLAPAAGNGR
ncbi:MarR family transcriptional regulator [Micromonospora sp. NPDC005305]|uniref:MarR family transcriptional regulator n=1 Tax=Micromonospora sp. NPDC005305 TaxID=3156875 RepID=UPI0033B49686